MSKNMNVKHLLMIAAVVLAFCVVPATAADNTQSASSTIMTSVPTSYTLIIPPASATLTTPDTPVNGGKTGVTIESLYPGAKITITVASKNEFTLVHSSQDVDGLSYVMNTGDIDDVSNTPVILEATTTEEVNLFYTLKETPSAAGSYTDTLTFTAEEVLDVNVGSSEELLVALYAAPSKININLLNDIEVPADTTLNVVAGKDITLNLNGHTLSSDYIPDINKEIFSVSGKLTVEDGILIYDSTHNENFNPSYRSAIFVIKGAGSLNLDKVTAKNNGGNWMAYVVDTSNSNGLTLTAENCVLESSYIPVRVFNNNMNKMHSVTIESSTLKGKSLAFWVQFYTDDNDDMSEEEIDATLSIDIFGNNNVFSVTQNTHMSPIMFGYDTYVYYDESGNELGRVVNS